MRIAAFDSGVGGLSALAPLLKNLHSLQINYLGDLANLPYGSKSKKRVLELAKANVSYLLDSSQNQKPDLLLIACNTVSAHALDEIKEMAAPYQIPVLGVIEAPCRQAIRTQPKRIVVVATKATCQSKNYSLTLQKLGYTGPILEIPCPLFVPLVEEGVLSGPACTWIIQKYLGHVLQPGDAVILGCTHYPFLLKTLLQQFPSCSWIQAGDALLQEEAIFQNLKTNQELNSIDLQFTDSFENPQKIKDLFEALELKNISPQIRSITPLI